MTTAATASISQRLRWLAWAASLVAFGTVGCSKSGGETARRAHEGAAVVAPPATAVAAPAVARPGRVVSERFHSDALGVDKDVVLYLPAGYDDQPAQRWPVYYYLHGLAGNETNWSQEGKLPAVADQLGLAAIVVMPDGDDGFYIDSPLPIDYDQCIASGAGLFAPAAESHDKTCVHRRNYETYVVDDLVGWVDAHYRTISGRAGRAIAGMSMGGFGAMAIALRHRDKFAAAASHSGALALLFRGPRPFAPGKTELYTNVADWGAAAGPIGAWIRGLFGGDAATWQRYDVVSLASQRAPDEVALYFDCGTDDEFYLQDNTQWVHEALTAQHIAHQFFVGPGRHDYAFWRARLPFSLAFLRDHTAQPTSTPR